MLRHAAAAPITAASPRAICVTAASRASRGRQRASSPRAAAGLRAGHVTLIGSSSAPDPVATTPARAPFSFLMAGAQGYRVTAAALLLAIAPSTSPQLMPSTGR